MDRPWVVCIRLPEELHRRLSEEATNDQPPLQIRVRSTLFSGRTSRSGDFGRERREFAGRRRPDFFDYLVDYEVEGRTDARLRVIFDNRHCTSMQSIIG